MSENNGMVSERLSVDKIEADIAAASDPRARADLLIFLALRIRESEQWDRMLVLGMEARQISEGIDYKAGIADSYSIESFVHYIKGRYKEGLAHAAKALEIDGQNPSSEYKARIVLGFIHWSLGNFGEALRSVDRATELCPRQDWISEAYLLTLRGGVYHSLGDYQQALQYSLKAFAIFEKEQQSVGLTRSYSGIGSAYQGLGDLEKAMHFHRKSLESARTTTHKLGVSRALNDIGETYFALGDNEKALEYHQAALEIRHSEGYRQPETTSLLNLGRVYRRLGDRAGALDYLNRGLAIAEEGDARPKAVQFHKLLSEVHEETGDLAAALHHLKAYETTKSELAAEQALLKQKAMELEAAVESSRKLSNLLEQLQAAQAELVNSERMAALGSLTAALAHELNSPLGVIQSASDLTVRCAEKLERDGSRTALEILRDNAKLISSATKRIQMLVGRLKNFAGLDQAEYKQVRLEQSLEDTIALLEPEFGGRIDVARGYGAVPPVYCYAAELNQVFMHLLRNAAQAIDGKGEISIHTSADEKYIRVSFTDSGRGIPEEQLPRLFTPGFISSEQRIRASLSLFTCFNIVKKHDGEIRVESRPGKGSTFTILLPRDLETRTDAHMDHAAAAKA